MRQHGPKAFEWKVEEVCDSNIPSEATEWALEREYTLIEENGGPLQNANSTCEQTLNVNRGSSWRVFLGELQLYKDKYGNCEVPRKFVSSSGFRLGYTIYDVRTKGTYTAGYPSRVKTLDRMGFVWNVPQDRWEKAVTRLQEFKDREGHLKVPHGFVCDDGWALGAAVSQIRNGKAYQLVRYPDRRQVLTDMGFVWNPKEEAWQSFFAKLKSFVKKNKHCEVPSMFVSESGYRLGNAVRYVRGKHGFIKDHPERVEMLNGLGFRWSTLNDQDWLNVVQHLQEYREQEGHLKVPTGYKCTNGFTLGRTVSHIRLKEDFVRDNPERRKTLDQMGFLWSVQEKRWYTFSTALQKYHAKFGDCRVPKKYKTKSGYPLGSVVGSVRSRECYIASTKDPQYPMRLKTLLDMGFTWNCRSKKRDNSIRAQYECVVQEAESQLNKDKGWSSTHRTQQKQ